jgi:hypothetical protein
MKPTNEPARALAWHITLWGVLATALYAAIWLGAAAIHLLGQPLGLLVLVTLVVVIIGTGSWWASGRKRP